MAGKKGVTADNISNRSFQQNVFLVTRAHSKHLLMAGANMFAEKISHGGH
jgi:hypothetical protein